MSEILEKIRFESSQQWIPMQASLELTNRCNERCGHCYLPSFKDDSSKILKEEDWYRILSQLREAGTLFLILMGGEAMLNPLFWRILERASDLSFHVSMITNGLKIQSLDVAQRLKELGLINVTISLYSAHPEIHDKMTSVKGSHQKTVRAIELCRQAGLQVTLNCLIGKDNIDSIFDLEDWALREDLMLKFDPMITPKLNGDMAPTEKRASEEQLRRYFVEKIKRWPNGKPKSSGETQGDYVCNAGKGKCAITYSGDVLPCIEIRDPMGNLLKDDFATLWNGHVVSKWREIKWKDIEGSDQETMSFCDHCMGMAKNETGSHLKMTCYSKMLAKIKSDNASVEL
ncbi:MAG: radical SAM protein [Bdellovibrionaceae bacterium]|nr:radical SAM protein [Pseudobdellovibrionaceae bacterium]